MPENNMSIEEFHEALERGEVDDALMRITRLPLPVVQAAVEQGAWFGWNLDPPESPE